MKARSHRIAGAVACVTALAVFLEAGTFAVGFVTDPVGPRGFPYLVSLVLGTGGLWILLRPDGEPVWPGRRALGRSAAVAGSFLGYAALLPVAGFFVATTVEMVLLSVLFGGRPVKSLLASAAFATGLWILFVRLLGLSLPVGSLFAIAGG